MSEEKQRKFEKHILPELDRLFRFALRLAGNQSQADDLVQETLLRSYRAFDRFEGDSSNLRSWLFKIMHNIYFNELIARKRRRVSETEQDWNQIADQHPEPWPEFDVERLNWEKFDEEIKKSVEELAPEHRVVLLLWALEELSYKEIAEICDIPIGTVMSRLYRARKQLAESLTTYAKLHRLTYVAASRGDKDG